MMKIKRALISASDKRGLTDLADQLNNWGVEIFSTGGTARALQEAGIRVVEVSQVTGSPELLEGRVKTLHPRIHGGILARRDRPDHLRQLEEHGIFPIDLVVVNLYPFESVASRPDVMLDEALENIDIGGPCMIRAAAKNFTGVVVVVDPEDYPRVIKEMADNDGSFSQATARELAVKAFDRTSQYDRAILDFLSNR